MCVVLCNAFLVVGKTFCPPGVEEIMEERIGVPHPEMDAAALKFGVETGEVTLRFVIIFDGLFSFSALFCFIFRSRFL